MHRALLVLTTLALSTGCRSCAPTLTPLLSAELRVESMVVEFPATYVGQTATAPLALSNIGGQAATVTWSVDAPFDVTPRELTVGARDSSALELRFAPTAVGRFESVLAGAELEVTLRGEGLAIPQCVAGSCEVASFDFTTQACRAEREPDGAACLDVCVLGGQCRAGACVGQPRDCSDGDACTLDGCGASGCTHPPVMCPVPSNPCRVAACESSRGCLEEDAPDGTLCGPDVCTAATVQVCLSGACTTRRRPDTGRCQNTWVSLSLTARGGHDAVWDDARQRVLVFGGRDGSPILGDTWEWDGASWTQRFPAQSPPPTTGHRLAYDALRRRVVLFGGVRTGVRTEALATDTWEWDGTTWLARPTLVAPPPRQDAAMVYDAARRKTVLFGGQGELARLGDTWEWDGLRWVEHLGAGPPARSRHAMAYDSRRQRVVLYGGASTRTSILSDVWEWDGTRWSERATTGGPGPRASFGLAFDADTARVTLTGGYSATGPAYPLDAWDWDGASWTSRQGTLLPGVPLDPRLVWDTTRRRLTLVASLETLALTGSQWAAFKPSYRQRGAIAFDAQRGVLALFGGHVIAGSGITNQTWEWNGSVWSLRTPATSPPVRYGGGLAFDAQRQRVVLFGGSTRLNTPGGVTGAELDDTWEWDGTTWTERQFTGPRPAPGVATGRLVFQPADQRIVLVGNDGRWTLEATGWQQASAVPQPAEAAFYDGADHGLVSLTRAGPTLTRWLLANGTWTPRTFTQGPQEPRNRPLSAIFDASRNTTVTFGVDAMGAVSTWEFDGTSWLERQPRETSRENGSLVFDSTRQKVMLHDDVDTWVYLP